jgi:protein TonB
VKMPSPTEFARYYPPEAYAKGISGHAMVKCQVAADGSMTNCLVVSESPEGLGFGDAMLKIAPHFRMKLLSKSGQPTVGWWINIPAAFNARH